MRNPLPVLAVALLAAVGAFAADLPTWTLQEEPFSAWRIVVFTDGAGKGHDLWCKWSECGKAATGTAKLYTYTRQSSEPYTYHSGVFDFTGSQSAKTTYSTELSHFVLDLKTQKAVVPGTNMAFITQGQRSFIPLGYIVRVLPPIAVASDLPVEKPAAPNNSSKKPGSEPLPKRKPAPHSNRKPNSPIAKEPASHAAPALIPLERGWLVPIERSAYIDATNAAKKPTAAALALAYKNARATIALNLRDELREPYKTKVAAGEFDKIEELLTGKNYSGWEVELKPEEYKALLAVVKTATSHADFVEPNAAAQYDLERKSIVEPTGKAKLSEHLLAHRIAEKFRAMRPGAKPGTATDGTPVKLTDADFAKVPVQADRDALQKAYNDEWAKADTDDKKRAVNEAYLKKIADKVAAANPPAKPRETPDFKNTKTLAEFNLLSDAEKKALCSMIAPGTGGGMDNCGDILANAEAAMAKCNPPEGAKKNAATLKTQSDCVAKVNACKAPSTPAPASTPLPATGAPTDAVRAACVAFDQGAGNGNPNPKQNIGAGKIAVDKALPGEVTEDKKADANFYTNLGNGVALGIGGLLLASFFGGPVLMLAVAVAAGVGGYYVSKSITEPKDDKKKK